MIFDSLWAHFWPADKRTGLSGVLQHILKEAEPSGIEFSRLVESVSENSEKLLVKSSSTIDGSASKDEADIVIVTVPSLQAKELVGHLVPDFVSKDLEKIQYESRAACSLVARMSPKNALRICEIFGPLKTEVNFEMSGEISSKLHLVSWQDRKYQTFEAIKADLEEKSESNTLVDLTFTIHSTVNSFDKFETKTDIENYAQSVLKTLICWNERNEDTKNTLEENENLEILKSRGVLWQYSQPTGPMETLYTEVLWKTYQTQLHFSLDILISLSTNNTYFRQKLFHKTIQRWRTWQKCILMAQPFAPAQVIDSKLFRFFSIIIFCRRCVSW